MQAPAYDHSLVYEVQTRATGANIHRVNNLLLAYGAWHELVKEDPNPESILQLQSAEKELRQTVHIMRSTAVPFTPTYES